MQGPALSAKECGAAAGDDSEDAQAAVITHQARYGQMRTDPDGKDPPYEPISF